MNLKYTKQHLGWESFPMGRNNNPVLASHSKPEAYGSAMNAFFLGLHSSSNKFYFSTFGSLMIRTLSLLVLLASLSPAYKYPTCTHSVKTWLPFCAEHVHFNLKTSCFCIRCTGTADRQNQGFSAWKRGCCFISLLFVLWSGFKQH